MKVEFTEHEKDFLFLIIWVLDIFAVVKLWIFTDGYRDEYNLGDEDAPIDMHMFIHILLVILIIILMVVAIFGVIVALMIIAEILDGIKKRIKGYLSRRRKKNKLLNQLINKEMDINILRNDIQFNTSHIRKMSDEYYKLVTSITRMENRFNEFSENVLSEIEKNHPEEVKKKGLGEKIPKLTQAALLEPIGTTPDWLPEGYKLSDYHIVTCNQCKKQFYCTTTNYYPHEGKDYIYCPVIKYGFNECETHEAWGDPEVVNHDWIDEKYNISDFKIKTCTKGHKFYVVGNNIDFLKGKATPWDGDRYLGDRLYWKCGNQHDDRNLVKNQ